MDLDSLDDLEGLSDYSTDDEAVGGDYRTSRPRSPLPTYSAEEKSGGGGTVAKAALGAAALALVGGLVYQVSKSGKLEGVGKKLAFWNRNTEAEVDTEHAVVADAEVQGTSFEQLLDLAGLRSENMLTFEKFEKRLRENEKITPEQAQVAVPYQDYVADLIRKVFKVKLKNIVAQLANDRAEIFRLAKAARITPDLAEDSEMITAKFESYADALQQGGKAEAAVTKDFLVALKAENQEVNNIIGFSAEARKRKAKATLAGSLEDDDASPAAAELSSSGAPEDRANSTEVIDYNDQLLYYERRLTVALKLMDSLESHDDTLIKARVKALEDFCTKLAPTARAQPALWDLMAATIITMWDNPGVSPQEEREAAEKAKEAEKPAPRVKPGFSNVALFGRSGVGKSTAASQITEMMRLAGVVVGFDVPLRPTRASELLNSHLGMSERQVRRAVYQAYEDVIFIDEAQGLGSGGGNQEVARGIINWLTEWLGEHPREIVMIIAGYGEPIRQEVFKLNYGLARRFRLRVTIRPHLPGALLKMLLDGMGDQGIKARPQLWEALAQTTALGFLFPKSAASLQDLLSSMRTALINASMTEPSHRRLLTLRTFWDALYHYTQTNNIRGAELLTKGSGNIILPDQVDAVFSQREDEESEEKRSRRVKSQGEEWAKGLTTLRSQARQRLDYYTDISPYASEGLPEATVIQKVLKDLPEGFGARKLLEAVGKGPTAKVYIKLSSEPKRRELSEAHQWLKNGRNLVMMFPMREMGGEESRTVELAKVPAGEENADDGGDLDLEEPSVRQEQDAKARALARSNWTALEQQCTKPTRYLRIEVLRRKKAPKTILAMHLVFETAERIFLDPIQDFEFHKTAE